MKKSIIEMIVKTLIVYNAIPIINVMIPQSQFYTFLMDIWIINSLWALIASIFFCKKNGFKIYMPLLLAILFIPTMFIFYNTSATIFVIIYFILALLGSCIGGIINKRYNKNK